MKNRRKIAVRSKEEIRQNGLCAWHEILTGGKSQHTGKTESDYIADGCEILREDEFSALILAPLRNIYAPSAR